MIYLTGCTNTKIEPVLVAQGIGVMLQPDSGYLRRATNYAYHAADNGCFAGKWTEDRWIDWLAKVPTVNCLFAVAPDVYPDAKESLRRGLEWAPIIRSMGLPVAVVAQDGAERLDWPWDELDCLFLGGEKRSPSWTEWKLSVAAERLVRDARRAGKWVHMGRVNSFVRLERAREMGCHSADGTFLRFPDANVPRLCGWLVRLDRCPTLPLRHLEGVSLPVHRDALRGVR